MQAFSDLEIAGADIQSLLVQPGKKLTLTLAVPSVVSGKQQKILKICELQFNHISEFAISTTADPGLGSVVEVREHEIVSSRKNTNQDERIGRYEIRFSKGSITVDARSFTASVLQELEVGTYKR